MGWQGSACCCPTVPDRSTGRWSMTTARCAATSRPRCAPWNRSPTGEAGSAVVRFPPRDARNLTGSWSHLPVRQINGEAVHRSVAEPGDGGAGLEPDQDERRLLTERVIAHAERFLTGNDATPTFVPAGGPDTADVLAEAGIPAVGRPI